MARPSEGATAVCASRAPDCLAIASPPMQAGCSSSSGSDVTVGNWAGRPEGASAAPEQSGRSSVQLQDFLRQYKKQLKRRARELEEAQRLWKAAAAPPAARGTAQEVRMACEPPAALFTSLLTALCSPSHHSLPHYVYTRPSLFHLLFHSPHAFPHVTAGPISRPQSEPLVSNAQDILVSLLSRNPSITVQLFRSILPSSHPRPRSLHPFLFGHQTTPLALMSREFCCPLKEACHGVAYARRGGGGRGRANQPINFPFQQQGHAVMLTPEWDA